MPTLRKSELNSWVRWAAWAWRIWAACSHQMWFCSHAYLV